MGIFTEYSRKIFVDTYGDSSGGGLVTVQNFAELISTYPNGSNQPVWVIAEDAFYFWDGVVGGGETPPPVTGSWTIDDNFNRADDTLLGGAWTRTTASTTTTWGIQSNQAYCSNNASNDNKVFYYQELGANGTVELTMPVTDAYCGIKIRAKADGTNITIMKNFATIEVYEVVNPSGNNMPGSISYNIQANDVLRVTFQGSTIKVYVNGVQVGSDITTTFNQNETKVGFGAWSSSSVRFDNFKASTQVLPGNTQPV